MEDDFFSPDPEPMGDLVPPPRKPPTAVAASPAPAPGEKPIAVRAWRRGGQPLSAVAGFVNGVFDVLDAVGDTIAETVGLRD